MCGARGRHLQRILSGRPGRRVVAEERKERESFRLLGNRHQSRQSRRLRRPLRNRQSRPRIHPRRRPPPPEQRRRFRDQTRRDLTATLPEQEMIPFLSVSVWEGHLEMVILEYLRRKKAKVNTDTMLPYKKKRSERGRAPGTENQQATRPYHLLLHPLPPSRRP